MPIDLYSTHQPLIVAAAIRADGPILECGVGYYSTPILHEICRARGLPLLSVDSKTEWLEQFTNYCSDDHVFSLMKRPDDTIIGPYALALIDNGAHDRAHWITHLLGKASIIIIHDTEDKYAHTYQLPSLADWRYRVDHTITGSEPQTTILSNTDTLEWAKDMPIL